MRRRINLLAMLFVCGGAGALLRPSEANAIYPVPPKAFCCYHQWSGEGCCGDNGCRINSEKCEMW